MMRTIKGIYRSILGFFPIRLLFEHFRSNHLLLIFWLVLFLFVGRFWGNAYGVPLLFLDPEYLGSVGFLSYFVLGVSFGAFQMAFQIASYLVNCRKFPFLAGVNRPFVIYTINNSIIPLGFMLVYGCMVIDFQRGSEGKALSDLLPDLSGFYVGATLFFLFSISYFYTASRDFFLLFGIDISRERQNKRKTSYRFMRSKPFADFMQQTSAMDVRRYLIHPFKIGRFSKAIVEDQHKVERIFRRNHLAAGVYEFAVFILLLVLGFNRDIPLFMIPAAGSIFLALTMLLLLASAVITWLQHWSLTVSIFLLLGVNYLSGYEFFGKRNRAYGLDYSVDAALVPDSMRFDRAQKIQVDRDTREGLKQLSNWKRLAPNGDNGKPTLVLLNVSGGGLMSAYWAFNVLQYTDSLTQGELFKSTNLITGSSGGMIGAAYYRELALQKQQGRKIDLSKPQWLENIGKDMLNPVGFSLAVSDVFFRYQTVTIGNQIYTRDRAYEFERALHLNTGFALDKTLKAYHLPEKSGQIPIMVLSPSVINDGRRMLISAQPISYLCFNSVKTGTVIRNIPEDLEFSRMFQNQGAADLRFSTAIRMSATFPYILPSVALPSKPILEVMDAGFRDNYGTRTSIRYLYQFRDWIYHHTDRVVIVQIRQNHKAIDLKTHNKSTLFELISSPLGNVYENMFRIQDYQHEQLLMYAKAWFGGKIELVEFDLHSAYDQEEPVSMNFHLTSTEKEKIRRAIFRPENQAAAKRLLQVLRE